MAEHWDQKFEELLRRSMPSLPMGSPIEPGLDLAALGLDSLAVVQLIASIEDTYQIVFPDELLVQATFASPSSLWDAIGAVRAAADVPDTRYSNHRWDTAEPDVIEMGEQSW